MVLMPFVLPSSPTGGEPSGESWLNGAPSRTGTATVKKAMALEARESQAADSEERPRKLPKAVLTALNRASARLDNSAAARAASATEADEILARKRRSRVAFGLKALFDASIHSPDG